MNENKLKASLFVTCIIDQFYPEVGEAVVRVLRHLDVDVEFNNAQTCCGQPAFNNGFWNDAKPAGIRLLQDYRNDNYIIVPSGSCASMLRVFYNELYQDDPDSLVKVKGLAPRVYEFTEFITGFVDTQRLQSVFQSRQAIKVTYHESCHLKRELGVSIQPRELIKALPNVELIEMPQAEVCCGFGGTFSVKYANISGAMLQDKIASIKSVNVDAVVAGDMSCLMQIKGGLAKQESGIRSMHIAQLLNESI